MKKKIAWAILRRGGSIIDNCSLKLFYSNQERTEGDIYAKEIFPTKKMARRFKNDCCSSAKIVKIEIKIIKQ